MQEAPDLLKVKSACDRWVDNETLSISDFQRILWLIETRKLRVETASEHEVSQLYAQAAERIKNALLS